MPYNFVSEDNDKFTLSNGDNEFSIAKYDLDDGFMERLRSLPRVEYGTGGRVGFAEGGMVQPEPIPQSGEGLIGPEELGITPGMPTPSLVEIGGVSPESIMAGRDILRRQQEAADAAIAAKAEEDRLAAEQALARKKAAFNLTPEEMARMQTPAAAPTEPAMAPVAEIPSYLKMLQGMAQADQPAPFMLPEDIRSGYDKIRQGTMAQAQAHANAALEQEQLYAKQKKDLEDLEAKRVENLAKMDNDINKLREDIASNKIDPNRIYSNMSTGNRVLGSISVLLGGLSQGLTGAKSNPAMDVMNNAIDRDIDAQKAELGKKQNLLSYNLAQYGRMDQAYAATKMHMLGIAQAQMNQIAAKAGSKQALAAAQVATGQMDVQIGMLKNKLAADLAASQKINNPQGLSFDDLMKLDDETRARLVPMPPSAGPQYANRFIPAIYKDDAKTIKDAYKLYQETIPLLNRVKEQMDKGMTLKGSAQNDVAELLKSSVILLQKNLEKLGAITEADMSLIMPLVPQAGKFFDKGERAKLDMLYKRSEELLDAAYAGRTGYNRSAFTGAQTSAFGRSK